MLWVKNVLYQQYLVARILYHAYHPGCKTRLAQPVETTQHLGQPGNPP
jgi:hypothetical protein